LFLRQDFDYRLGIVPPNGYSSPTRLSCETDCTVSFGHNFYTIQRFTADIAGLDNSVDAGRPVEVEADYLGIRSDIRPCWMDDARQFLKRKSLSELHLDPFFASLQDLCSIDRYTA
jgi:hypothetical protein